MMNIKVFNGNNCDFESKLALYYIVDCSRTFDVSSFEKPESFFGIFDGTCASTI